MKLIIDDTLVRKRIDKVVADSLPLYSRAALSRLFTSGHIKLNKQATRAGIKLRLGDEIEIDLTPLVALPEDITLPIIYEDNDVIVINKPSGVISHARGKFVNEPSVASFVRKYVADMSGDRAGIVHRLDRATSGVMICAKNQKSLSWLQQQFADRKVMKTYYAVVTGKMPTDEGIIDMPIARDLNRPKVFKVDELGKPAVTTYKTTHSTDKYSVLLLEPRTGRTHQIRVHLSQLKHPIVGDELYGGEKAERLMLHAYSLEVALPSGEIKIFSVDMPAEFNKYE